MATIATIGGPPKIGRTSRQNIEAEHRATHWPSVKFKSSTLLSRPAIRYRDLDGPALYRPLARPANLAQLARDDQAFRAPTFATLGRRATPLGCCLQRKLGL